MTYNLRSVLPEKWHAILARLICTRDHCNVSRLKLKTMVKGMGSIWSWLLLAAAACQQGAAAPFSSSDTDPAQAKLNWACNYFEIDPSVMISLEELRDRKRQKLLRHHPDKAKTKAEVDTSIVEKVNGAYQLLEARAQQVSDLQEFDRARMATMYAPWREYMCSETSSEASASSSAAAGQMLCEACTAVAAACFQCPCCRKSQKTGHTCPLGKEFFKVLDERKAAYYQICAHEGHLKALEWHTRVASEQAGRERAEEHIRNAAAKAHKQLFVTAVKMQSGQIRKLAY